MQRIKRGFMVLEAVFYTLITTACISFFIFVLQHVVQFYHYTHTALTSTLYHLHCLHLLREDCAKALSYSSPQPHHWEFQICDVAHNGQLQNSTILYTKKGAFFYRTVFFDGVRSNAVYTGPAPLSLVIKKDKNNMDIMYQASPAQCFNSKVPVLCAP
ncbi:MAG: hypothetical protein WCJ17_00810 [bacterium]